MTRLSEVCWYMVDHDGGSTEVRADAVDLRSDAVTFGLDGKIVAAFRSWNWFHETADPYQDPDVSQTLGGVPPRMSA